MGTEAIHPAACPLCEDTGWKTSSVDRGVRTVSRCDCRLAARNVKLLSQAEIPPQYAHCTLDSFDVTFRVRASRPSVSLRSARLYAREYFEYDPLEKP